MTECHKDNHSVIGRPQSSLLSAIRDFMNTEAAGGIFLIIATVLAMVVVNSPFKIHYDALLDVIVAVRIGEFEIYKPLLLWINDGLMAVFFFLIGLEIKREVLVGELADRSRIVLPLAGAVGGMATPALIYVAFNWGSPIALEGWAIPSATDIAFALGILSLLGDRVPHSLKVFLLTLAIIDDLGAIIVIALFYTSNLSVLSLVVAFVALAILITMNRRGVVSIAPYLLIGLIMWAAVLKSGVHATLAGVLIAFCIPFKPLPGESKTQLEKLEHDLHPAVVFGILPLFAFANTGIPLLGLTLDSLLHPVPLGIALGLFLGNQFGVFILCWLTIKFRWASLPQGASWLQLYGVGILCGIGFTMSLFVSSLAFEQGGQSLPVDDRLGILVGTLASAVCGYALLRYSLRKKALEHQSSE